jgi:uncharacterized MAPEG superfamily protein
LVLELGGGRGGGGGGGGMDEKQRTSDLSHSYASISGRSQSCSQKVRAGFLSGAVFGASMSGLSAVAQASQLQIRWVSSSLIYIYIYIYIFDDALVG